MPKAKLRRFSFRILRRISSAFSGETLADTPTPLFRFMTASGLHVAQIRFPERVMS